MFVCSDGTLDLRMIVGFWSGLYCTCGVLIRRPVLVEVFNP